MSEPLQILDATRGSGFGPYPDLELKCEGCGATRAIASCAALQFSQELASFQRAHHACRSFPAVPSKATEIAIS